MLVHNQNCANAEFGEYYVKDNGVTVRVIPGEGEGQVSHNLPHAHVTGNGPDTTVGMNMTPMKGHPALSQKQMRIINKHWNYIEVLISKVWRK